MRILHVSTSDLGGGAALAAYRLHRAMLQRDADCSRLLVRQKLSHDPTVIPAPAPHTLGDRVAGRLARWRVRRDRLRHAAALGKLEIFSDARESFDGGAGACAKGFDIVQLHWVSRFLNFRRFFREVPSHIPLVWRLPDMNPFTGGCHYDGGCGRFAASCGACPQLESTSPGDLSATIWAQKRRALAQLPDDRLHLVALNRWMADQVRRSGLFGRFACSVIPNGVDLDEFYPAPKAEARAALDLPAGRQVVAFVADSTDNVRKGFALLVRAVEALADRKDLLLLVVGKAERLPPLSLPTVQVGQVKSTAVLRQVYSAADVFVIPSLQDNQPNTVLESMACGTPVVGFRSGGIPEMVESGSVGLLAPRGDVPELGRAMARLLDDEPLRAAMGRQARDVVAAGFSRATQVENYFHLYRDLLGNFHPAAARSVLPAALSGSIP